jgi:flagellar biosynthesis protein FlhB
MDWQKMARLLKAIYRFTSMLSKIPKSFYTEIKTILTFTWKHERSKKQKQS